MLVILPALNYSGFCLSERRYLTEREVIDIGVREHFQKYPPAAYADFSKVVRPIDYASVGDFMVRNPKCCSVTETSREGVTPGLIDRLVGRFAGFVRIEYKLEDNVPGAPDKNVVWVAVTNCGKPWNGIYWGH
jgi:hypothetical protein